MDWKLHLKLRELYNLSSIMSIKDLSVAYYSFGKYKSALNHVTFDLNTDEVLGILGESGSGKSTIGWSLLGMIEPPHKIEGEIIFDSKTNVLNASEYRMKKYRWSKVAMIFQTSMNSFDPLVTVGKNFVQLLIEKGISTDKIQAKKKVIELFRHFNLPDMTFNLFPFELSGGMKQRASIAVAISCSPTVLIADEPTTALDTVSQFTVIKTLKDLMLNHEIKSMIFITHDVSVQFLMADRIIIMLGGRIVEDGKVDEIKNDPKHPYTTYLLAGMLNKEQGNGSKLPLNKIEQSDLNAEDSCPFVSICPKMMKVCLESFPKETPISDSHTVFCHLYGGY